MLEQGRQPNVEGGKRIGDLTVWTISDGRLKSSLDVLVGIERAESERLTGVSGSDPLFLPVNCFLIRSGEHLALIDVGAGSTMGPTLGQLPDNLRAMGVAPETLRTILLTHLHPDHSNGLVDAAGQPVFPNAELILHEREAAFWLDQEVKPEQPERTRRGMAASQFATAPYRDRIRRVQDGEVLPGISAVLQAGHTPGHTGWMLQSHGDRLLVWGDIVHLASVQVPLPQTALAFDVDPDAARETRLRVFERVAAERLRVGGAHVEYPGFGYLTRRDGGYVFEPET